MKFHPQAADRKAFPLGLSILWQHQQQRLVGTCTHWLNHGPMEPWWFPTAARAAATLGFPGNVWRCWGCSQRRSSDSTQTFEARNLVAEPSHEIGGWAHCGMVNKHLAEAYRRYLFKHIWSLEEQYLYIYIYIIYISYIYTYIYIIQIRKVSLQILVDHRYRGISSRIRFFGGARVWVKNLVDWPN
jgi:hypothetical protein